MQIIGIHIEYMHVRCMSLKCLQEVITNHQLENAHIEETTEVPPSSKRGTRKKNTVFVDTEVVTTTAPVRQPKKFGKALELDTMHKNPTIKNKLKDWLILNPENDF